MAENSAQVEVSEKPILFSGAMVRAILESRKTMTRRVAKPETCGSRLGVFSRLNFRHAPWIAGTRLWVRETFTLQCDVDGDDPPFNDGRPIKRFDNEDESGWLQPHYRATDPQPELTCPENPRHNCDSEDICASPWRPSIYMPRWASRITLEIVSVKVERVQEISLIDCQAEGITLEGDAQHDGAAMREAFRKLWDSINSKPRPIAEKVPKGWLVTHYECYPWSEESFAALYPKAAKSKVWRGKPLVVIANPWVWAIEFKVLAAGERRA
jgi:hypothetical protein